MQNKKIVQTLTLLNGVLLSSVAFSAPQFYGKFSLGLLNSQESATQEKRSWEVENQSSRVGFKGTHQANDSLQLLYQLEVGVNPADSTKPIFSMRNSFLGVQGNFGQVIVGTFDTPLKSIQGKVDLFNSTYFDMSKLVAGEVRHKQSLQYSTGQIMDSVTLKFNWLPSDEKGLDDGVSASAEYKTEQWTAALAFDSNVAGDAGVISDKSKPLDSVRTTWTVNPIKPLQLGLLAQYTQGVQDDKSKEMGWLVSAAWQFDKVKLKSQIGQGIARQDSTGERSKARISQLTLGVDYALAKNTTAFAYTGMYRYEKGAGGIAANQTANRGAVGAGLTYQF